MHVRKKSKHEVNWLDVLENYRSEHYHDWLKRRLWLHQNHKRVAIETEVPPWFHTPFSAVVAFYCFACSSPLLSSWDKSTNMPGLWVISFNTTYSWKNLQRVSHLTDYWGEILTGRWVISNRSVVSSLTSETFYQRLAWKISKICS